MATFSELHKQALKLSDELTSDDDLRQIDLTEMFYAELNTTLAGQTNGGLVNINVNGQPGSGKSTVMGTLVKHCNDIKKKKTTIHHILANQIVYTQVMRRITKPQHICIGIDEYDEIGDTGYNTTVDKAALNHYSDLHRANYIHKIACSPQDLLDKNCYMLLDVLHAKKEQKRTFCTLSYIFYKGGVRITQLLGHVWIEVGEFLKSELYKEYEERKMQRLRMFSHYGLKSEKDIFVAKIILDAYYELAPLSEVKKIDSHFAEFQIDMSTRKLRGMNSWFASNKFTKDLLALLASKKYVMEIKQDIAKLKAIQLKKGIDLGNKIMLLQKALTNISEKEGEGEEYWKNAAKLESLYMSEFGKEENGTTTPSTI